MRNTARRLRDRWNAQGQVWEALLRAQRPWEQEGPLRWEWRLGDGWCLHGAAAPEERRESGA